MNAPKFHTKVSCFADHTGFDSAISMYQYEVRIKAQMGALPDGRPYYPRLECGSEVLAENYTQAYGPYVVHGYFGGVGVVLEEDRLSGGLPSVIITNAAVVQGDRLSVVRIRASHRNINIVDILREDGEGRKDRVGHTVEPHFTSLFKIVDIA